jgi:LCP family protein required for cell wall assembly
MRNQFRRQGPLSRYSDVFRSMRTRERRHMRHRWQWIALGVVVVLAVIAGVVVLLYYSTAGRIQEAVGGVVPVEKKDEPFNALLVGSDSRRGLTEREQLELGAADDGLAGERADTLIVAHVDPNTDHVTMIQFPRDLWVRIPGAGRNRINAALLGGKSKLVQTVRQLTGLRINHYVQINIAGFRDLVNAIGGVDVCIPEPIPFDRNTGIEVPKPGMVHFNGNRALRFVRSRKVFGEGDLARIQNQQKFLAAAIDRVTSVGTLINPGAIRGLIRTAGDNLRIDRNTDPFELYRLGQRLRSFDPRRYEAYTVPNRGPGVVDGASVILPDLRAMRVMFDAIAANQSPAEADGSPNVDPTTVEVGVYNGTSEEGAARRAARRLREATDLGEGGVSIDDSNIANARRFSHRTTLVRYAEEDPRALEMARLVAAALPGAEMATGPMTAGVDVAVIVGRHLRVRPVVQIRAIPIPKPGELPKVCRP